MLPAAAMAPMVALIVAAGLASLSPAWGADEDDDDLLLWLGRRGLARLVNPNEVFIGNFEARYAGIREVNPHLLFRSRITFGFTSGLTTAGGHLPVRTLTTASQTSLRRSSVLSTEEAA